MKNKRGEVMNLIFPRFAFSLLSIIVVGGLMFFVSSSATGAVVYEQAYAKQVALVIDNAKPDMQILIDFSDGIRAAEKNKKTERLVRIDEDKNLVIVDLGSGGYSYRYFSDYPVTAYEDAEKKVIVVRVGEKVFGVGDIGVNGGKNE